MPAKVTVEKRLKRAGATPLFCGQAAQKVLWGRSRPPAQKRVPCFFHGDKEFGLAQTSKEENNADR